MTSTVWHLKAYLNLVRVLFLFVHLLITEKYSIKKLDHINVIGLNCSSKEKKNLCVLEFLRAAWYIFTVSDPGILYKGLYDVYFQKETIAILAI